MTAWSKWGDGEPREELEPTTAMSVDRYCPRCIRITRWTNEHDHGLTLVCPGCGLVAGEQLTTDEQDRLDAHYSPPVPTARRGYTFV